MIYYRTLKQMWLKYKTIIKGKRGTLGVKIVYSLSIAGRSMKERMKYIFTRRPFGFPSRRPQAGHGGVNLCPSCPGGQGRG